MKNVKKRLKALCILLVSTPFLPIPSSHILLLKCAIYETLRYGKISPQTQFLINLNLGLPCGEKQ